MSVHPQLGRLETSLGAIAAAYWSGVSIVAQVAVMLMLAFALVTSLVDLVYLIVYKRELGWYPQPKHIIIASVFAVFAIFGWPLLAAVVILGGAGLVGIIIWACTIVPKLRKPAKA